MKADILRQIADKLESGAVSQIDIEHRTDLAEVGDGFPYVVKEPTGWHTITIRYFERRG